MPAALSPPMPIASKLDPPAPEHHILDPEGDVMLTMTRYLECEDISELGEGIGDEHQSNDTEAGAKISSKQISDDVYSWEQEVVIRASSRHLILASSVFRAMLQRRFNESNVLQRTGSVEIPLPDDDPDAFLILLNIIHGHMRKVPAQLDIQTFTQVAVLVDKYDLHECVVIFANFWFEGLKHTIPQCYTEDIPGWICISWIFNRPQEFKHATRLALRQGKEELPLGELPIPAEIVAIDKQPDTINTRRVDSLSRIVSTLHIHLEDYSENEHCSFECDSLMLGALTKRLKALNLLPHRPDPPFSGLCFEQFAHRFKGGLYFPAAQRTSTYYYSHSKCAIPSIEQALRKCDDQLEGLELSDYKLIE
ncbi:hypothetical protein FQN51_009176 [Onygenales sp. PD_10]|nr:hypothetical protein FQN51_009176 [Onygenales sp. PD_10]